MEILSINAATKLANIACSIGSNPMSWQGWKCLFISLEDMNEDVQQDCLMCTRSIAESYLRNFDGRTYYCGNEGIHIICKGAPEQVLLQAGTQICELVKSQDGIIITFHIYDLMDEALDYSEHVRKQRDIFSWPSFLDSENDDNTSSPIMLKNSKSSLLEKNILNNKDYPKVLLVEDDPVTRWMVRNALKYECHFAAASCANGAFAMYTSYKPDVVFLDINLPDNNGYSVLQWIIHNDPGACVVMFSSNDNLDNIVDALQEGASGFIAKPFLKESLIYYIKNRTHI